MSNSPDQAVTPPTPRVAASSKLIRWGFPASEPLGASASSAYVSTAAHTSPPTVSGSPCNIWPGPPGASTPNAPSATSSHRVENLFNKADAAGFYDAVANIVVDGRLVFEVDDGTRVSV